MIQNIVDRAKKMAIKDFLDHEQKGLRVSHLLGACVDEFKENEDLPNTTNPDDWARISGKKGERIVFIRTLVTGKQGRRDRPVDRHGRQHRPVPVRHAGRCPRDLASPGSGRAEFVADVGRRAPAPARSGSTRAPYLGPDSPRGARLVA